MTRSTTAAEVSLRRFGRATSSPIGLAEFTVPRRWSAGLARRAE